MICDFAVPSHSNSMTSDQNILQEKKMVMGRMNRDLDEFKQTAQKAEKELEIKLNCSEEKLRYLEEESRDRIHEIQVLVITDNYGDILSEYSSVSQSPRYHSSPCDPRFSQFFFFFEFFILTQVKLDQAHRDLSSKQKASEDYSKKVEDNFSHQVPS